MPRKPRKDFPGAWHHIMNRGARREPIFKCEQDCILFLEALGDTVERHGLEIHSYSLMTTHYHLFARSLLGNLSRCMQYLSSTYTQRVNASRHFDGPIFRGRFKNQIVSNRKYQRYLDAYIHLNPIKAHLAHRPTDPCWTSHRAHLGLEHVPNWLITEYVHELFGGTEKMRDFVTALHVGSMELPEVFQKGDGFLPESLINTSGEQEQRDFLFQKVPVHKLPAARPLRFRSPESVLVNVCEITGRTLKDIRVPKRGQGANPARRFTVWALRRSTLCKYQEIADTLEMPYNQVVRLLSRFRHGEYIHDIRHWVNAWLVAEEES